MNTALAVILIVFLFASVLTVLTIAVVKERKRAVRLGTALPPPPKEQLATYGHPESPTQALRKQLPKAPQGYAWETKTTVDDNGHWWMHLTLVEVATSQNMSTKKVNLTMRRVYEHSPELDKTWADEYRKYPSIAKASFKDDLISPMADWAQTQAWKELAGKTFDYEIGA